MANIQEMWVNDRKTVLVIAASVLIVVAGYLLIAQRTVWLTYHDELNKVQFSYPKPWSAGSTKGFVKLISDPVKPDNLNMLIKIDQPQLAIDYFHLGDAGVKLALGDKSLTISHQEVVVPASARQATSSVTFTHLYWKDKNGHGYMFEISPSQKNGLDGDLSRIIGSFNSF